MRINPRLSGSSNGLFILPPWQAASFAITASRTKKQTCQWQTQRWLNHKVHENKNATQCTQHSQAIQVLWQCQHEAATHTLCVCVCVAHVVCYRIGLPGLWGAWRSGVGRRWPLTQNWRKGNKRWLFSSLQLGLTDHWRDLTGGVELPAFDGRSPRLHHMTAGFADTLCTKENRRRSWINCNGDSVKLKTIWKTFTKD